MFHALKKLNAIQAENMHHSTNNPQNKIQSVTNHKDHDSEEQPNPADVGCFRGEIIKGDRELGAGWT